MSAETLVQQGELKAALAALSDQVRSKPADANLRVFLFQLLAVLGQWDRANTQLEMSGELDSSVAAMVMVYRDVINCELHRQAVFAGKSKPLIFGKPEEWVALLVEAQQAFANGDLDAFNMLNSKALEMAPASSGNIDGEAFEWLADADQRLGPVFEMIFNGQYYWVPMANVRSVTMEDPVDLRDLVWQPAEVTWTNGGRNAVMMPSRYPLTDGATEGELMARGTNWKQHQEDLFEGIGQRMLATDKQDYSFLQVRSIQFNET